MVTASLRPVWAVTGNNVQLRGDLGRRVVPIDLDPKVEHPEDRVFQRGDLLGYVRMQRERLVVAALTDFPGREEFEAAYLAEYGTEPSGYSNMGYACAQVVLDAIGRAAATSPGDPAALREAVRAASVDPGHEYDTILGSFSFDANGDTTMKIISIYSVDLAAAGGAGDWVFADQLDFGAR